jgi:hypothetical protein
MKNGCAFVSTRKSEGLDEMDRLFTSTRSLPRFWKKWEETCPAMSLDFENTTDSLIFSMHETKHLAQKIRSRILSDLISADLPDWTFTHHNGDIKRSACGSGDKVVLSNLAVDLEPGSRLKDMGSSVLNGYCNGIRVRSQTTHAESNGRHQYLEASFHPLHELPGDSDFAWTLSHHHEGRDQSLSVDPDNPDSLYQDDVEGFFLRIPTDLRVTLRSALPNHAEKLTDLNQCFSSRSSTICRIIDTLDSVKRYLNYSVEILEADKPSHRQSSTP